MALTKEEKAKKWLSREGFGEDGYTYIYYGLDSYDIKDDLKAAGFRFNRNLLWHSPTVPAEPFAEKTFKLHRDTVIRMMAWGEGMYYDNAAKIVKDKIEEYNPKPASNSNYIEPVKNKIDINAICTGYRIIETAYGLTNLITFRAGDDEIAWFTSSTPDIKVGDEGELVATFKSHNEYNGVKQTIITRAKLKKGEE